MNWKAEASATQLVAYDFECKKCELVEERLIKRKYIEMQKCSKCQSKMESLFPIGKQLNYETDFKPIYDYVTSWDNKWVTSRSEFRARLKRSGAEQCGDRQ